jgi:hypothetical protein
MVETNVPRVPIENGPYSITEIIASVRLQRFSVRHKFFEALNKRTMIPGVGTVAWPHAMIVLSVGDWNDAFFEATQSTSEGVKGA